MGKLFGTNGVRGIVNQDLTPDLATRLGQAVGTWLPEDSLVAVARDARTSGPMFEAAVTAGLLASGARVVRLGILPTPGVQFYVKTHPEVAGAIIVTASHNPPEFNGLKLVASDGTETSRDEEDQVEHIYFSGRARAGRWNRLHAPADDGTANESYIQAILSHVDAARIRKRAFRVVLDTGGGPGGPTSQPLLERLGCTVTGLFTELDGEFKGRKSEPVEENLSRLRALVREQKADLGIAHDGDADRCIFVDANGTWVSGDASFALLAEDAVRRAGGGAVVTPVSTSSLLREVVERAGGTLVTTAVGSPIVAREMLKRRAVFGGEENGGIIFPQHQHCRDGAMTAAAMLDLLARAGRPLADLVAALPQYHVTKQKFSVPPDQKERLLHRLGEWVRAEYPTSKVDATDGLKIYTDKGWVLVRASGTESIFRVFAESKDAKWSKAAADRFVQAAQSLVAPVTR